jgi:hypothetical protein
MPADRRSAGRTVIGPSNRRAASAGPEYTRAPRSPFIATLANVLDPSLQPSASSASIGSSDAQAKRRAPANMPKSPSSGSLGGGFDRPSTTPGGSRERAAAQVRASSAGGHKAAAAGAPSDERKNLSGHQEYAMQVMVDFFSRRPLEQLRNSFRNADKDGSGQLDQEEFVKCVKALGSKLTEKDTRTLFQLADEDGSGTLGIDEFFINFRHDKWPREKFFWDSQCGGGANLSKTERKELGHTLNLVQQLPAKKVGAPHLTLALAHAPSRSDQHILCRARRNRPSRPSPHQRTAAPSRSTTISAAHG